jgi:hypothetical protein
MRDSVSQSQHREQQILEEKIMRALPALQEANFVSQQLGRGVQVSIKIHTEKAENGASGANSIDRTIVYIQAQHTARYFCLMVFELILKFYQ